MAASPLSPSRLNALTDGIFAIAMTLLVLDLKDAVPEPTSVRILWMQLWPHLASYGLSFIILGLFWNGQHIAAHYVQRTDRTHLWLNIAFLGVAALIPYSASLLSGHFGETLPVMVYGINLIVTAAVFLGAWIYATTNRRLTAADLPESTVRALKRRMYAAIGSYLVAMTVALFAPALGLLVFLLGHVLFVSQPVTKAA